MFCAKHRDSHGRNEVFYQKLQKNKTPWPFNWTLNWNFSMIFGSKGVEFEAELQVTKKCIHQKLPQQRDSNGRSEVD